MYLGEKIVMDLRSLIYTTNENNEIKSSKNISAFTVSHTTLKEISYNIIYNCSSTHPHYKSENLKQG